MVRQHAPTALPEKPTQKLRGKRVGVGISWDQLTDKQIDIDLQAVIVDSHGMIVDAVYYNNMMAMKGLIGHSGDEQGGDTDGVDECIWASLPLLPTEVVMIIFVVAAYDSVGLDEADNGEIMVFEDFLGRRVAKYKMERTLADVDVVCVIRKDQHGDWLLQEVDEKAKAGSHFLDIVEPTIGNIIRKHIPGAPSFQQVHFQMAKGCVTDFPKDSIQRLCIGIGGKLLKGGKPVDIDINAVFFASTGKSLGQLSGDGSAKYGCTHTGDERASHTDQSMDDEAITVDLPAVPDIVGQIFFLLTIADGTFAEVKSAYARVCDQTCAQLAKFQTNVEKHGTKSGLIIARLIRSPGGRWAFQAIGRFIQKDNGWQRAHKEMVKIFGTSPDSSQAASKKQATKSSLKPHQMEAYAKKVDDSTAASAVHFDEAHGDDLMRHDSVLAESHSAAKASTAPARLTRTSTVAKIERLKLLKVACAEEGDELEEIPAESGPDAKAAELQSSGASSTTKADSEDQGANPAALSLSLPRVRKRGSVKFVDEDDHHPQADKSHTNCHDLDDVQMQNNSAENTVTDDGTDKSKACCSRDQKLGCQMS